MEAVDKPGRYQQEVADAIAGHGPADPVELWMLHEAIDARQRDMIDADELNRDLLNLAAAGLIRELPGHLYVDATLGDGASEMSQVSAEEWEAARREYGRWFGETYARLKAESGEPARPVALVRVLPPDAMEPADPAFGRAMGPVAEALQHAGLDAILLRGAPEDAFVVQGMHIQDGPRIVGLVRGVLGGIGLDRVTVTLETVDEASTFELM